MICPFPFLCWGLLLERISKSQDQAVSSPSHRTKPHGRSQPEVSNSHRKGIVTPQAIRCIESRALLHIANPRERKFHIFPMSIFQQFYWIQQWTECFVESKQTSVIYVLEIMCYQATLRSQVPVQYNILRSKQKNCGLIVDALQGDTTSIVAPTRRFSRFCGHLMDMFEGGREVITES